MTPTRRFAALLLAALTCGLASAAWSEEPPPLAPEVPYRAPRPVHRTLANGASVLVVEAHQLPLVTILVAMGGAGSTADPAGRAGLAGYTTDLLDEGAGGLDALALAERLERLGARVRAWTEQDAAFVEIACVRHSLDRVLPLAIPIVTAPGLADADAARVRDDRLAAIRLRRDEPMGVASVMGNGALWGPASAYGHPPLGYRDDLSKLGADDARAFYRAHWGPERMTVVVAGDVTPDEARAFLDVGLGAWKPAGTRAPIVDPVLKPAPSRARLLVVDRPGSEQSDLRIAAVGVPRKDERAFAVDVLVNLLGGTFTSRLDRRLREELGWTYGVSAQASYMRGTGLVVVETAVMTAKTVPSVEEILRTYADLAAKLVNDAELKRSRLNLVRAIPRWFDTNEAVAEAVAALALAGLPDDWFDRYRDAILKVTAVEVRRVAKALLASDRLVVVLVGDLGEVGAGIGKVGLGAPKRYDPDGVPIP